MSHGPTRREFLKTAALTGAAVGLAGYAAPLAGRVWAREPGAERLKVLVLGGTGQTGPHLVRALLDGGHTVTLFNRGNRSEEIFPQVECLIGDRQPDPSTGLEALQEAVAGERTWDVCIDIWPHIPKLVENTALLLKGSVGRFMYVSSISVYTDFSVPGGDEDTPVGEAPERRRAGVHGRALRPLQGRVREPGAPHLPRQPHHLPARPDRRAPRLQLPRRLLAGAGAQGRRGAGPRRRQRPGADHRRPRPDGLPGALHGAEHRRHLQRHRPGARASADHARPARGLQARPPAATPPSSGPTTRSWRSRASAPGWTCPPGSRPRASTRASAAAASPGPWPPG